jgi:hypothetical protein
MLLIEGGLNIEYVAYKSLNFFHSCSGCRLSTTSGSDLAPVPSPGIPGVNPDKKLIDSGFLISIYLSRKEKA